MQLSQSTPNMNQKTFVILISNYAWQVRFAVSCSYLTFFEAFNFRISEVLQIMYLKRHGNFVQNYVSNQYLFRIIQPIQPSRIINFSIYDSSNFLFSRSRLLIKENVSFYIFRLSLRLWRKLWRLYRFRTISIKYFQSVTLISEYFFSAECNLRYSKLFVFEFKTLVL